MKNKTAGYQEERKGRRCRSEKPSLGRSALGRSSRVPASCSAGRSVRGPICAPLQGRRMIASASVRKLVYTYRSNDKKLL